MDAPSRTIVNRPDLKAIYALECELVKLASACSLPLRNSEESTYAHLTSLNRPVVEAVGKQMHDVVSAFKTCALEKADVWDDKDFFRISMRQMGLTYPSDFLDKVGDTDLVEAYDLNRLQIFRNLRFMEHSTYTLLDLLSYEWPLLFDRSSAITQQMISYCDEILWSANRTIPFNIPLHFIRELRSSERQVLQVRFKYLCPLFAGPNKPFGIVGTCQVTPVGADDPIGNIEFV